MLMHVRRASHLAFLALALTVLSVEVPPLATPPEHHADFYAHLVEKPSIVVGAQTKRGMIPADRWDEGLFNREAFPNWILNTTLYKSPEPSPAPRATCKSDLIGAARGMCACAQFVAFSLAIGCAWGTAAACSLSRHLPRG